MGNTESYFHKRMKLKTGTIVSGQFLIYHGVELWKAVADSGIHHGLEIVEGVNTANEPFDPSGACQSGGIYFTTLHGLCHWKFHRHGAYARRVTLKPDELVWIDYYGPNNIRNKFKAYEVNLGPLVPIIELLWDNNPGCLIQSDFRALNDVSVGKFTSEMYETIMSRNLIVPETVQDLHQDLLTSAFWEMFIDKHPGYLLHFPKEFHTESRWQSRVMDEHPGDVHSMPDPYKTDEFWDMFIDKYPGYLLHLPEKYHTESRWRTRVLETSPCDLHKMPAPYKTDEFWEMFIDKHPAYLLYFPDKYQTESRWRARVYDDCPGDVHSMPEPYKTDDFWNTFLNTEPANIFYAPNEFQTYDRWVTHVITNGCHWNFKHVPDEIRNTPEFMKLFRSTYPDVPDRLIE